MLSWIIKKSFYCRVRGARRESTVFSFLISVPQQLGTSLSSIGAGCSAVNALSRLEHSFTLVFLDVPQ